MDNERIVWGDLLKIFAIFAVIILHLAASNWEEQPVNTFEWNVFNFYDASVRWCVPIFVMLSGMVFLNPSKNITRVSIFKKYLFRILCSLFFWGVFYGLLSLTKKIIFGEIMFSLEQIILIIGKLVFGPPWYHLWFLYLIIGLYLLTPLIRIFIINSNKKDIEYSLILFLIFGTIIPLFNSYSSNSIYMKIPETGGYVGYYIAGYYFSKYNLSKSYKSGFYVLGIVSVICTILLTSVISIRSNFPDSTLYAYLSPTTMFTSFAIFIFFKSSISNKIVNKKLIMKIKYISSCTFGIYLVHDVWLQLMLMVGVDSLSFNPLFSIPILTILVFLFSLITIMFINKIPILNKYII
jgi:surface polysaccharide O-acyltransferase-like enzyme